MMIRFTTPAIRLLVMLSVLLPTGIRAGTMVYDTEEDAILVQGFAELTPATMDHVLQHDREQAWGKVLYDAEADTYTVDASLHIGSDQDLGTFFQIGREGHVAETVIVKGDVWIRPPQESPNRSDGRPAIVNRLTLGHVDNAQIRPALKIACTTAGEFGVFIGLRTDTAWVHAGELFVYNSTITAAVPDADHRLGAGNFQKRGRRPGWYGSNMRLVNAVLSWGASYTYGINEGNSTIEGTTFEHGASALANGQQFARNCIFRDLKVALREGGCLKGTLIGCTFENNERNWTLGSVQSGDIVMIDCDVGPQQEPVVLRKNRIEPEKAARARVTLYPACIQLQSLVVKAVDEQGNPLSDTWVDVTCKEDANAVRNGLSLTDERGLTPDDLEKGAILITTRKLQATDDPEQPKAFSYTYRMTVKAKGYEDKTVHVRSGDALPRPMVVTLTK